MPINKCDLFNKSQLERIRLIDENTNLLRELSCLRKELKRIKRDNVKMEVLLGISRRVMSIKQSERLLKNASDARIDIARKYIDQFEIMINQMIILDEENERLKSILRQQQRTFPRLLRRQNVDLKKTLSLYAFQSPSLLVDQTPTILNLLLKPNEGVPTSLSASYDVFHDHKPKQFKKVLPMRLYK